MGRKRNVTHKDLMEMAGKWEKKPKEKPKENPVRNAHEFQFPQRKQRFRDTEKKALEQIENFYRTPQTNLHDKRPALLHFKADRTDEKFNFYWCELPDKLEIRVQRKESAANPYYPFVAYYVFNGTVADSYIEHRLKLQARGNSYTDAVAHLLAIPQFYNRYSQRWMSYHHLADIHIHIPGNPNPMPKNPGKIPTQEWLDAKNKNRKPIALPQGTYKSFEELRLAMGGKVEEEPKEKPVIPISAKVEIEEALEKGNIPFVNQLHTDYRTNFYARHQRDRKIFGKKLN